MQKSIVLVSILLLTITAGYLFMRWDHPAVPDGFNQTSQSSSGITTRSTHSNGTLQLRTTISSPLAQDSASLWIATDQQIFSGLYTAAVSPYPGAISDSITCPSELIPEILQGPDYQYTYTHANSRLNYGVCDPVSISRHAVVLWKTCPNKTISKIELFSPDPLPENTHLSHSSYLCR